MGMNSIELILQSSVTESGNPIIIVHAKHVPSNRTTILFSVIHRPNKSYPVTILLDSYKASSQWTLDTPFEFQEKLSEIFNSVFFKERILELANSRMQIWE